MNQFDQRNLDDQNLGSSREKGIPMFRYAFLPVLILSVFFSHSASSIAQNKYNPQHPEVRAIIAKGMAFLKQHANKGDEGDQMIVALAALNSHNEFGYLQDPLVLNGINVAQRMVPVFKRLTGQITADGKIPNVNAKNKSYNRMYEACVALMLFIEFDDQKFDKEIRTLIDFIVKRQSSIGSWTYNSDASPVGDTSQTQYCCLALWIAKKKGFEIPIRHASSAARFWTAVQAQNGNLSGTWAYKCRIGTRQGSNKLSLTAAGAGSLYMLGDIMQVNPTKKVRLGSKKKGLVLPAFVKRLTLREIDVLLKKEKNKEKLKQPTIDAGLLAAVGSAKRRSQDWFSKNYRNQLQANTFWSKYALYGFERYATFREEIDGEVAEMPDWYDQGIEFVKKYQKKDGSWGPTGDEGTAEAQTALAILFMVRSTQRLTRSVQDARLKPSKGFKNTIAVRSDGSVVGRNQKKDMESVLNDLTAGKKMSPEEQVEFFESLLTTVESSVKGQAKGQQLILLRSLVNEENHIVRKIGVRILGQTRLIDNCPALIYALTDPSPTVVEEAGTALLFVSRKINAPPIPSVKLYHADKSEYEQQQRNAYRYWAKWYLELDPEARLLTLPSDSPFAGIKIR